MTLLSFPLSHVPGTPALPGLAPAGEVLFFASPKKSTQKKGEPGSSSLRCAAGTLRCSARAGSAETRPAGSDICSSFSALAYATRLLSRQWGTGDQIPRQQGRAMARPCGIRLSDFRVPLCLCRGAQVGPEKGLRMSEPAGRVCADPGPAEHRRLPRRSRGHRHQGRLLFAYFLLAKQEKVSALSGAHPDVAPHGRAIPETTSLPGAHPGKAPHARAQQGAK